MKKKLFFLLLLPMWVWGASSSEWRHFGNFREIREMAFHNEDLWVVGIGGVARLSTNNPSSPITFMDKTHGLPSLSVEGLAVHPTTGDIWIGTYDNGIARWDGNTWEHIQGPGTQPNVIYKIRISPSGNPWVATNSGVFERVNEQWVNRIAEMTRDFHFRRDGRILYCADGDKPKFFDPISGTSTILFSSPIYSLPRIFPLDDNRWVFGVNYSMYVYDDALITDTVQFVNPNQLISAAHVDGKIVVILGTSLGGQLWESSGSGWSSLNLGTDRAQFVLSHSSGIWTATPGIDGKIIHLDTNGNRTTFSLRQCDHVSNPYKIKTLDDGELIVFDSPKAQLYNSATGLFSEAWLTPFPLSRSSDIQDALRYGDGWIVATTAGAFTYSDTEGWQRLGLGFLESFVEHLVKDEQGRVWFAGDSYLARWNGQQLEMFTKQETPVLDSIRYLNIQDLAYDTLTQTLYVATNDGLITYRNGLFEKYNGLSNPILQDFDDVTALQIAPDGKLWLGTRNGGVIEFDGTDFLVSSSSRLPPFGYNHYITGIAFYDEVAFVSTNATGIWKKENGNWSYRYDHMSPLSSNNIYSIAMDKFGNLWASNYMGLDVYKMGGVVLDLNEVQNSESGLSVAPNPFSDQLNIEVKSAGPVHISLVSPEGKNIGEWVTEGPRFTRDLSSLAAGLYLLHAVSESGVQSVRVIKR
jgi:hypothetical protein